MVPPEAKRVLKSGTVHSLSDQKKKGTKPTPETETEPEQIWFC